MATTHGVLVSSNMTQARQLDSLRRSFQIGTDIDNGHIITLGALVSGEDDTYVGVLPSSAVNTLELWMVNDYEVATSTDGYKGLTPDARAAYVPADTTASCFKLKNYDRIVLDGNAIAGTFGTNTHVNVATTGKLVWAASASNATIGKLVKTGVAQLGGKNPTEYSMPVYTIEIMNQA